MTMLKPAKAGDNGKKSRRKQRKSKRKQRTGKRKLAELLKEKSTLTVDEVYGTGELGGRNQIYEGCHRGDYDCFRAGKRIHIVSASLARKLGLAA
jgi:hypothetical protein